MTWDEFQQRIYVARHEIHRTGRPFEGAVVHIHPKSWAEMRISEHPYNRIVAHSIDGATLEMIGLPLHVDPSLEPGQIILRWEVAA